MLETAPTTAAADVCTPGLRALLTTTAYASPGTIGWIRVTGEDRVRWLNGMATNSIQLLKPGEGCYNFFLNAQGRIQGDAMAWMLEDAILLETDAAQVETLMALLDHFIIMDDVELNALADRSGLLLAGPDALNTASRLDAEVAATVPALRHASGGPDAPGGLDVPGGLDIVRAYSPIGERVEFWGDADAIAALRARLPDGMAEATFDDLNDLRILSGVPRYGVDIRNSDAAKDLPQETNQARALHFSKGCYLGQEIVERIRSRGQVHRGFGGFLLEGAVPSAPASLFAADAPEKPAGELTSVARIALPGGHSGTFALGYIRREVLELKKQITYAGGIARPSPLPFPLP